MMATCTTFSKCIRLLVSISVVNRVFIPMIGEYIGGNLEGEPTLIYYNTKEAWSVFY